MKTPFETVEDDFDGWTRSLLIVIALIAICIAFFMLKDAGWKLPKGADGVAALCIVAAVAVMLIASALFGSLTGVLSWADAALATLPLLVTIVLFLSTWPVYYMLRPFWKWNPKREQCVPPNPRSPSARGFGGR